MFPDTCDEKSMYRGDPLLLVVAGFVSYVMAVYVGMVVAQLTAPIGELSTLPSLGPSLGLLGLPEWAAFLASVGIVLAVTAGLYALTTSLLERFQWSPDSWLSGLMLETFRTALWLLPAAWVLMASLLPWAWPVVLAAAIAVPVVVALVRGLVLSLCGQSVRKLMMFATLLKRGVEIDVKVYQGMNVTAKHGEFLLVALTHGNTVVATHLINSEVFSSLDQHDKRKAFEKIFRLGDLGLVRSFLEKQTDIKMASKKGQTWLNQAIALWPGKDATAVVTYLIEQGAQVNVSTGHSPLQQAVLRGDVACVRFLLKKDADPDYFDRGALTRDRRGDQYVTYGEYGAYISGGGLPSHSCGFSARQMMAASSSKDMQAVLTELSPVGNPIPEPVAPPTTVVVSEGGAVAPDTAASLNADPPAEQTAAEL